MGNKREELEVIVRQERYDVVAIMETWWDDSHDWSAVMDDHKLFRKDRRGNRDNHSQQMSNSNSITKFLLLAFTDTRELQLLLFWLFLGIYLAALLGNGLIIIAIAYDHRLHTPMCFFLLSLSLLDIGSISTTVPKSMAYSFWDTRAISYLGCAAQVFFVFFLFGAEYSLLTVMAYDRYVALCKPLHYGTFLSSRACVHMTAAAWDSGFLNAVLHTANTFSIALCQVSHSQRQQMSNSSSITKFLLLPFAERRELQLLHFWLFLGIYLAALLGNGLIITAVACNHRLHTPVYFFLFNLLLLDMGSISTTVPKSMANSLSDTRAISYAGCAAQVFFFLMTSEYSLLTIMAYDRYFAICKPLHYGTLMGSRACVHMAAAAWAMVPPAVNPLIYSLRNKELKDAIKKVIPQMFFQE
ncbi:olfactory receptor 14I1-like [Nyctibius grandis]|uniref:olfactory receptor 14I1-like n=1 Tax=Nyctibius grandis TaxID=48427 RepID=UPI0035BBF7CB